MNPAEFSDDEGNDYEIQNINNQQMMRRQSKISHPNNNHSKNIIEDLNGSEDENSDDDNDILLKTIALGMTNSSSKLAVHNNSGNASSSFSLINKSQVYRDNQFNRNVDSDLNMQYQCIQHDMPKPKKSYNLPTKFPNVKLQPHSQKQPPSKDHRAAYMSSYAEPRKSPTSDCKTLSTRPGQMHKSPTKERRIMPVPSHSRQYYKHKKSPTAEDRVLMLPSMVAQHSRKSPSRVPQHPNVAQHKISLYQERLEMHAQDRAAMNAHNRMAGNIQSRMALSTAQHRTSPSFQDRLMANVQNTMMMNVHERAMRNMQNSRTASYCVKKRLMQEKMSNAPDRLQVVTQDRMMMLNARQYRASPSCPSPSNHTRKLPSTNYSQKCHNWIHNLREPKIEPSPVPDATCIYRTEDTPVLSRSASNSDLSTLSFSEDKVYLDCSRNNSRNSDCSSDSGDEELLQQCIRAGMHAK